VAEIRYGKIVEAEKRLNDFQLQIKQLQGDHSLLKEEVDSSDIAGIVAKWTGIPVTKMLQSERDKLLHLEDELSKRVAGQEEAIRALSDAVRRSRAAARPQAADRLLHLHGYDRGRQNRVIEALAEYLFNDENAMVRIDMSEYRNATVSVG